MRGENIRHSSKDSYDFLINLLDSPFYFMTVGVRSCKGNAGLEETDGEGKGLADRFGI